MALQEVVLVGNFDSNWGCESLEFVQEPAPITDIFPESYKVFQFLSGLQEGRDATKIKWVETHTIFIQVTKYQLLNILNQFYTDEWQEIHLTNFPWIFDEYETLMDTVNELDDNKFYLILAEEKLQ